MERASGTDWSEVKKLMEIIRTSLIRKNDGVKVEVESILLSLLRPCDFFPTKTLSCISVFIPRVVIKSRGPGIFPGYFYWKIEEK